jgi:hypothetical protein
MHMWEDKILDRFWNSDNQRNISRHATDCNKFFSPPVKNCNKKMVLDRIHTYRTQNKDKMWANTGTPTMYEKRQKIKTWKWTTGRDWKKEGVNIRVKYCYITMAVHSLSSSCGLCHYKRCFVILVSAHLASTKVGSIPHVLHGSVHKANVFIYSHYKMRWMSDSGGLVH